MRGFGSLDVCGFIGRERFAFLAFSEELARLVEIDWCGGGLAEDMRRGGEQPTKGKEVEDGLHDGKD